MSATLNRLSRTIAKRVPVHAYRAKLERPLASFTFDDFPVSALETGGRILESRGVRATYYACGEMANKNYRALSHFAPEHLAATLARGHELGCHAFEHVHFSKTGPKALSASIKRNAAFFQEHLGDFRPVSFAYPFGDADWAAKWVVSQNFPIARGVWFGPNIGRMDFSQLRATPLDTRWKDHVDIEADIARTKAARGWLIFFTHDVQENPTTEGCAPDLLARTLDAVLEAGFEVLPVKAAAARVRFG